MDGRRPLASRSAGWARNGAAALAGMGVTPNQISVAGAVLAALGGLAMVYGHYLLAALGVQARLICNLLDGMVAVEGGKGTASGAFYNELPDRFSDSFILIAAGYAAGMVEVGYLCALVAAVTAYVRVLGASLGTAHLFTGPMAKQHRMAVITVALVAQPFYAGALAMALWAVLAGSAVTVADRSRTICRLLEQPLES